MLRRFVLILGIFLIGASAWLLAIGQRHQAFIPALIWGILLAGGIIFERYIYKPTLNCSPGPGFIATAEKTSDENGPITVWHNPNTGERAYVRDS